MKWLILAIMTFMAEFFEMVTNVGIFWWPVGEVWTAGFFPSLIPATEIPQMDDDAKSS